jgi:hypothetical protein
MVNSPGEAPYRIDVAWSVRVIYDGEFLHDAYWQEITKSATTQPCIWNGNSDTTTPDSPDPSLRPVTPLTTASCPRQTAHHVTVITLGHTINESPLFIRATVTSERRHTIHSVPLHGHIPTGPINSTTITPGTRQWLLPIGDAPADHLEISTIDGSAVPCIQKATTVQVATVLPHHLCSLVGPDGSPGAIRPCTRQPTIR